MGAPRWPPNPHTLGTAPAQPSRPSFTANLRGGGCLGERSRAQDARDLLGIERLALEQGAGERVQLFDVLLEDLPGARGAVDHDALDLAVDGQRGLLAVVLLTRDFAAEEDVLFVLAERERAELVRHAPLAHHLARHL